MQYERLITRRDNGIHVYPFLFSVQNYPGATVYHHDQYQGRIDTLCQPQAWTVQSHTKA